MFSWQLSMQNHMEHENLRKQSYMPSAKLLVSAPMGVYVCVCVCVCVCARSAADPRGDLHRHSCCGSHRDVSGESSGLLLLHTD